MSKLDDETEHLSSEKPNNKSSAKSKHTTGVGDEQDQLLQDLKRVQADFVNFKRGVDIQLSNAEQRGKMQTTLKFLDMIDDIERALNYIPQELQDNQWVQGLEKIKLNLDKKMSELKLSRIEAMGQRFDPEFHEAVMQGDDSARQDVVSEVLKNGYTYEGIVVRHAMVKVG
jgi:molecular chaperone GrpE